LINEALPSDLRNYSRTIDKKSLNTLLKQLAEQHPEEYREVLKKLTTTAAEAAYAEGSMAFGLSNLLPPLSVRASRSRLNRRIHDILQHSDWSTDLASVKIIEAASKEGKQLTKSILNDAEKDKNPLASQVRSGARGNAVQLQRLLGGDILYLDHHGELIPLPMQTSYSEGLDPVEYWASSYGARKGIMDTKLATARTGTVAKQLNQLTHRLMVTQVDDKPQDPAMLAITKRGFPVDVDDPDNDGALLAVDTGGYPRNTIITPKISAVLRRRNIKKILVRSPIVGGPSDGGVYARDVGIREKGELPPLGDNVGLAAAQAISERLTQSSLGSKHIGGSLGYGRHISGFDYLNSMLQVPKHLRNAAVHASTDGRIAAIEKAPAGGTFIRIANEQHYVPPNTALRVHVGDTVEAGDVLSEGIPNPSEVVKHKGVGEGRKYFVQEFLRAYRDAGMPASRRNVELLSRGLLDHVELIEEDDNHIPGDIVPYSRLERTWTPRKGFQTVESTKAVGKYLEKPVLHYTIGTRIQPSVVRTMQEFGINAVDVHDDPPPFRPVMVRAAASVAQDPDWMARLLDATQKKSLLTAAHRGQTSSLTGTSFVHPMAAGVGFGKTWPQEILGK